jgi:carboxyl-terminal processing protease
VRYPSGRSIQAEGVEPDVVVKEENPSESKEKAEEKDVMSEACLHGHLKNEGEAANGRQEELGSSSYVNPDKAKDTQLIYALDLLHGVDSMSSDAAKKRAEAN